ncbi:hypothetical protein HRbin41_00954 [bacterium HR41]|nr:hypothetical protein HRbin41_00954 [bacterium HR41]
MSASDTRKQILETIDRLLADVPAFRRLRLVLQVTLRARGGDAPIWRVELPARKVVREPAPDARLYVEMAREEFNRLAGAGFHDWAESFQRGRVRVTGDSAVVRLLGEVGRRALARAPAGRTSRAGAG